MERVTYCTQTPKSSVLPFFTRGFLFLLPTDRNRPHRPHTVGAVMTQDPRESFFLFFYNHFIILVFFTYTRRACPAHYKNTREKSFTELWDKTSRTLFFKRPKKNANKIKRKCVRGRSVRITSARVQWACARTGFAASTDASAAARSSRTSAPRGAR